MPAKDDPRQAQLYFPPAPPATAIGGGLNIALQLRLCLSRALKECAQDRAAVAALMTQSIYGESEGEITKAQLDKWTAPSAEEWRFPLEYLPAFVQATGAVWLLDWVAQRVGCRALIGEQALLVEASALQLQEKRLRERRQKIMRKIQPSILDQLPRGPEEER